MNVKKCGRCNIELSIDNFSKGTGEYGVNSWCKDCSKQYRIDNKVILAIKHLQYLEKNKEAVKAQTKKYRENHKEKAKQYRESNKVSITDKITQYRLKHLDQYRIYAQTRKARVRLLPFTLTKEQWEEIKLYFNYKCAYCEGKKRLTIEHFIPVTKFGELTINNVLSICTSCNSSKGNRDFSEWYPVQIFYSAKREKKIFAFLNYKNNVQQTSLLL